MEVLVLIDFEGTLGDEMTVRTGDLVKKVTKASEEGWLAGEIRGRRGIFPANFAKEVPVYLIGDHKREPTLRKSKMVKQQRKCEVSFSYTPLNEDELQLNVGETVVILREIEDGWWLGMKDGRVGAFPSNFAKEIFAGPKEAKNNEGKTRPKLTDAVFTKESKLPQKASVRRKPKADAERALVMFDYAPKTEDELELKKGNIVSIINKETEDEGWWEGKLDGRQGFFPDNFVMAIPPQDAQSDAASDPPARTEAATPPACPTPAMDRAVPTKTKDEKPDLRSNPPVKVKLPSLVRPSPPPVKDKPGKVSQSKSNGDLQTADQFDGVEPAPEKLSHPTAGRAKPPGRRPPSGLVSPGQDTSEEPELLSPSRVSPLRKSQSMSKASDSKASAPRPDPEARTPPGEPSLEGLQADVRELRMALELLKTRQEQDMKEVKEELNQERQKRTMLQEEVHSLRMKH
ncbi:SH3 domain-containing protein 21 [Gadus macrocephalus]|uniref:SH3 domain-containing protein 21 n=1 Tax=Gadus macrocephalus TaxID=80720 RepID=UPI0028CB6669|nr:SH3 domain-containing protein 21 [Gadus macrocephalus]